MRSRGFVWLGALAILLGAIQLSPSTARAADEATGAGLLPPQTLFYFSVPDVPYLKEKIDASLLGQLLKDEGTQPFLNEIKAKIGEASGNVESELGVTLDELMALPAGEITFAIVEKPTRKLSAILAIDCGENEATLTKLLDKLDAALENNGSEKSTKDVKGIEVTVFKLPMEAENPFKTLAYFATDGYVVFGSEVAAVESVIERWQPGQKTLVDDEVFTYVSDSVQFEEVAPVVEYFINPIGLTRSAIQMVQGQVPQAGLAVGMLPILGIDKLRGFGGAVTLGVEEFDTYTASFLYIDQPTTGLVNVFQFPAEEQAPPAWVPATAAMYMTANWDVTQAYESIAMLVDSFQGPGATERVLDGLADSEIGIHVKKDVIDNLDGHIHLFQADAEAKSDSEEVPVPKFVFALGVKDEAAVQKLLAKAAAMEGFEGEQREFNGHTLYEMTSPNGGQQTVGLTVSGGHLFIATDVKELETVLRSGDAGIPLSENPEYKRLAEYFPEQTSMMSFQNSNSAQTRQAWETMIDQLPEEAPIDLSTIPSFEVISKYIRAQASYTVPDEKGVLFVGMTLSAEK